MLFVFLKIFFTTTSLFIFGHNLNHFLKIHDENYLLVILKGIIFVGFLALFTNFFLPLSQMVNTSITIIFTLYFITKFKKINWKKILQKILLVSFFSFILLIYSNGFEPDASLYHLPATYNINNEKIIIGLNNIHFRMGIVSILQYINAFHVNFINGSDGILFASAIAVASFLIFLVFELFNKIESNNNYLSFFLILLIAIISFRFNRYSDFGNDALGHIFFLILMYELIDFKKFKNIYLKKNLNILIIFLCLQKVFFLYLIIIPILSVCAKIRSERKIQINLTHYFSFVFLFLWILKNILVTGCLIYPVNFTCSKTFAWYDANFNKAPNAKLVSLEGEAWSKNWNKNQTNLKMESYIKNFNWLETWKNDHFKKIKDKLSPFLSFIIFLVIIKFFLHQKNFVFYQKREIKKILKINYIFPLAICLIGSVLWFLKFPIFRYGSSFILVMISFFSLPLVFNNKFKKKSFVYLVSILLIVFVFKNFNRIYFDFEKKPLLHKVTSNNFEKLEINGLDFYSHDYGCGYSKKLCTNYINVLKDINVKKKGNYIIIFPK